MKKLCPFINEECREQGCSLWGNLIGQHPQTGEQISQWECAINLIPVLLVENAQQSRQVGAAIESFRNEVVSDNTKVLQLVAESAMQALPRN